MEMVDHSIIIRFRTSLYSSDSHPVPEKCRREDDGWGRGRNHEEYQRRSTVIGPCMVVEDISVDWRGRSCEPNKHGGMTAAIFVLGFQAFEMMAIAAVGSNLITYAFNEMHFLLSKSANVVTNFIDTVFLLSLLGGFLSDSHLGSFRTMLIFGFVELLGFILLSVQAHVPNMRPPECNMVLSSSKCMEAKGFKSFTFFVALYFVAVGSG